MDKLTYALMTLVVLCVLPIYSELRSVKEKMNSNRMEGVEEGDVSKTKIHSTRDGVNDPRRQKQTLQSEKLIRNNVEPNLKTGKGSTQTRKVKTGIIDATPVLQSNKHLFHNPIVKLHKINERNPSNLDEQEEEANGKEYNDNEEEEGDEGFDIAVSKDSETIEEVDDEGELDVAVSKESEATEEEQDEEGLDVAVSKDSETTENVHDEKEDITVSKSKQKIKKKCEGKDNKMTEYDTEMGKKKDKCEVPQETQVRILEQKLPKNNPKAKKNEVCQAPNSISKKKN